MIGNGSPQPVARVERCANTAQTLSSTVGTGFMLRFYQTVPHPRSPPTYILSPTMAAGSSILAGRSPPTMWIPIPIPGREFFLLSFSCFVALDAGKIFVFVSVKEPFQNLLPANSHIVSSGTPPPLLQSRASERAEHRIKNDRDDNFCHPCNLLLGSLAILIPRGGILDP